jgi:hypothetical protein
MDHEPFDTPGRPKCPGEPDGIHFYKLKQTTCHYCGLLDSYQGDEEFSEAPDDSAFLELCGLVDD